MTSQAPRPWDLVELGTGLAAAVLGIALSASGVAGLATALVAWATFGGGTFLAVKGAWRLRVRRPDRRHSQLAHPVPPLATRLGQTGTAILGFKRERDAQAPLPNPVGSRIRHPIRASRVLRADAIAALAHDRDTLSLYFRLFGPAVRILVRDLLAVGLVGANEARSLTEPLNTGRIEAIGTRLLELSTVLSRVNVGSRQLADNRRQH